MPRITISEKDLTINNEVDVTQNVVFIPGISQKEVAKAPKRYDRAEDFIKDFGNAYKFVSNQTYEDKTIIGANEYERSYIYALELLTAGLPIYFYNIINVEDYIKYVSTTEEDTYVPNKYYKISEAEIDEETYKPYKYLILEDASYKYSSEEFDETITYYTAELIENETYSETYFKINDEGIVSAFYDELMREGDATTKTYNPYQPVLDRWTYNIKFITSGGYPVLLSKDNKYSIPETMLMAATYRGDAEALIDDDIDTALLDTYTNVNTIFTEAFDYSFYGQRSNACNLVFKANENRQAEDTRKYGNIIAPGGTYYVRNSNLINQGITAIKMPGSYAYLLSLVNSVEILKNPDYFAIAGVSRGQVPNIASLINEPTGAEGEEVQDREGDKISINPILYVQNYDYCIWGNRTLFPNPTGDLAASSFANIRVMSADVKKVIYQACKELTFETNGVELWLKFKAKVEPLLEQMVANGALESFNLLRKNTTQKATLAVYVSLVTEYAVEDFDITIGLTDTTVEEVE